MDRTNITLIEQVRKKAQYYLTNSKRSEKLLEKMEQIDRARFLPEENKKYAYLDEAVSIGYGQTCSQPSMVAFILDELDIRQGHRVLEIGSGCGYASAIASRLCGEKGKVWSIEIVPGLAKNMKNNIKDNYPNITIISGDGSIGLKEHMPFDRIFFSAGVYSPTFNKDILLDQLTLDGILIYPETQGSLFKVNKNNETTEYRGVRFVPLKGENS